MLAVEPACQGDGVGRAMKSTRPLLGMGLVRAGRRRAAAAIPARAV